MIEELLAQEEGKTLEFKENTHSLGGIVKTVIAFANTAGGILVIGVKNRTKEIIGLFDDRIEFTNPGGLPFGQTLQKALAGFSRLRNRVVGRVFRELNLIEQWGSGLQKILTACKKQNLKQPKIEELNNQFRLTIFSILEEEGKSKFQAWEEILLLYLQQTKSITTKDAAQLWKVTDRTARSRLKIMAKEGSVQRIGTSEKDPRAIFILRGR